MYKTSSNNNLLFHPQKNAPSSPKTVETAVVEIANDSPPLPAKRARTRERYNEGYHGFTITGPIFTCAFNCQSKEFLPKFIVSMQSLTLVELICKIDSRSDHRVVLEDLHASPLAAQVKSRVKETEWAWTTRYIYEGSPEAIKPLFHFVNDRLYSDAYVIVGNCEYTPLEIFEDLWEQAYEYCLSVPPKSEEPDITDTLFLVVPMNYGVQNGHFNLTWLGTHLLPWLELEFISERTCELTIVIEKKNDLLYLTFITKLQKVVESLKKQLTVKTTESLTVYTLILDVRDLREKICPILDQEIFAKYCGQLPSDSRPRPLSAIFYDKLQETQDSFSVEQLSFSPGM